jgi:ActR/RegA family two-component response regulator
VSRIVDCRSLKTMIFVATVFRALLNDAITGTMGAIEQVLHAAGDSLSNAARLQDMHRRTLQRILRRYQTPINATQ